MPQLKFYDLKKKKPFTTDKYTIEKKGKRWFAVTTAPSGAKAMRIVSNDFAKENK